MKQTALQRADDFGDVLANTNGTYTFVLARTGPHIAVLAQHQPVEPGKTLATCIYELPNARDQKCEFTRDFLHFLTVERRPRTVLEGQRFVRQWAETERKRK